MYERDARTTGFGDEVKRRIMLGTYALSAGYYDAYYGQAQRVRTLIRRDFDAAFEGCDALLAARPRRRSPSRSASGWTTRWRCTLRHLHAARRTSPGLPGLSVPAGSREACRSASR